MGLPPRIPLLATLVASALSGCPRVSAVTQLLPLPQPYTPSTRSLPDPAASCLFSLLIVPEAPHPVAVPPTYSCYNIMNMYVCEGRDRGKEIDLV